MARRVFQNSTLEYAWKGICRDSASITVYAQVRICSLYLCICSDNVCICTCRNVCIYMEVMFVYVDVSAYLCECYHCICRDKDCIYAYPLHMQIYMSAYANIITAYADMSLHVCICIMLADIKALHIILSTVGITDMLTYTL